MKRYLLFLGMDYYPKGGFNDYVNSYDVYDKALKDAEKLLSEGNQWWQIVDIREKIIYHSNKNKTYFLGSF